MITQFDLSPLDDDMAKLLHARLSWGILEAKFLYYYRDASPIPDHDYDQVEKLYEALCQHLGETPTATDMVGFDQSRPVCGQVFVKWQTRDSDDILPKFAEFLDFVKACAVTSDTVDGSAQV